jgi:hypothetical protein
VLHLIAVRVVRTAHDPGRAGVARDLALLDHVVEPEADAVDANESLPAPCAASSLLKCRMARLTMPSVRNTLTDPRRLARRLMRPLFCADVD